MRFLSLFLISLLFFNADVMSMKEPLNFGRLQFEQLKEAVSEDDVKKAEDLITSFKEIRGINLSEIINTVDSRGATLLFLVIYKQNPEMATLLLKNGADSNGVNPYGETVLFLVLRDWKEGPIKSAFIRDLILKYEADTKVLLNFLFPVDKLNLEDFAFLLDHDPMLVNAEIERFVVASSESILFYAIRKGREGDPSFARLFLEKGSDPNVFDPVGETPLSLVLLNWEEGPIKSAFIKDLILKYGADTKVLLNLFFPVDKLNLEDVKFLVGLEPELVNARVVDYAVSLNNESILSYAVRKEDLGLVEFLLKNGASPNEVRYEGKTPSSMAKHNSCSSLFESMNPPLPKSKR